ncbi:LysM peptidoglycan-binding domain-containing protein [Paenibacillus rhizophilus]|uniref:LysM peptidoglycan-binding domain-containing protein n=1 Tax=Paenibacillus rhizophilus TaxID=1850366 RepID=UPI00163B1217|nr:LysM peptidoglycan-binding domain-containing protein [Paenibacillus rhizophilus]
MKIHIVKQGDTLYELSKKYGVPLDKVIEANPQIANPEVLAIGDKVKIPSVPVPVPDGGELFHKHTVMQGDTLWKLSKAWGIQLKDIIQANPQLKNPDMLKIGDIVNIPKKGAAPMAQQQMQHETSVISDKTTPGGKAYTGPIEKEKQTAPIAPVAPVAPAPVAPVPIEMPPAPVTPVSETIHTESQSLFVQISVPAQEAVSCPPMPEPPKDYCTCEPITPCEKSYGYPGITENPYYNDCPPTYPMYEAVQPMSYAPCEVQPAAYMPEMQAPYSYPGPVYPVANMAAPCYPGVMPGYATEMPAADFNPYPEHPAYTSPQYGGQPTMLPWPSCGCGGPSGMQPYQSGYEAPVYGAMPVYTSEAQSFPCGMVFPEPYMAPSYPAGTYGSPVMSGIPPVPEYPGKEDWAYLNRIPGETQVDAGAGESSLQEERNTANLSAVQNATQGEAKAASATSTAKVKTSSRRGKEVKQSGTTKQQSTGKSRGTTKKRRNPWISD